MPRIRLKTKLVLAISGMVFALVAVFCYVYVAKVVRTRILQASDSATFVAQEIREFVEEATLVLPGETPANSDHSTLMGESVEARLQNDPGLKTVLSSILGYSNVVYDASVQDTQRRAIVHTTDSLVGKVIPQRANFDALQSAPFFKQLLAVYGAPRVYDITLPLQRQARRFGEIHIGISTVFLRKEIKQQLNRALIFSVLAILVSMALAAGVSNIALRPLEAIGRRLDQMTGGAPDGAPDLESGRVDEYGLVNTKIDRLGRQIKDVKEVFTALKENLDQIMGTLQDGLILFTRDAKVVLVSASVERFVGRPRSQILGRSVEDVFDDTTRLGQIVLDAFALHRQLPPREIELENGRCVQMGLDFISERGERIGALLTIRDVESVRRIEDEIELSRRLASIGRLTSGVAHEVKNPINSIVVHLELLREKMKQIDPATQRHLEVIGSEIHRLDRVVQTLVDFNRPVELRPSDFDLRRLADDVVTLAAPDAERQGVRIQKQLGGVTLLVRADADLVKQALLNVVLNGVQSMEKGGVLTISGQRRDKTAVLEVADQGRGIPPEIRDKIFNLYFTTKKAGSGIGLAMAYRVLQMHHGALEYETELGTGTRFRLSLPTIAASEKGLTEFAASTPRGVV